MVVVTVLSRSLRYSLSNVTARIPHQSPIGSEEPIGDSFPSGEAFAPAALDAQSCNLTDALRKSCRGFFRFDPPFSLVFLYCQPLQWGYY
jgi:hypothetical protein